MGKLIILFEYIICINLNHEWKEQLLQDLLERRPPFKRVRRRNTYFPAAERNQRFPSA